MIVEKIIMTTENIDIDIEEITLLSKEEYKNNTDIIQPLNYQWWLRSSGPNQHYAVVVFLDGSPRYDYVDCGYYFVRPALKVDRKNYNLKIGNKIKLAGFTWTVLTEGIILCDSPIIRMCFRKNLCAENANIYEYSDVKKFLDKWAEENMIKINRD